jgi:predicted porin
MKLMKYLTIAAAVATVAAQIPTASAETNIYGSVRAELQSLDTDGGTNDSLDIEDRTSRLGIKGSTEINDDLKIFGRIEYGLSAGGEFRQGEDLGLRQAHFGLKGDFGTLTIGSQTPLWHKMVRGAYMSDGNDSFRHGTVRDDDLIQYINTNEGLKLGVEVSVEDEDGEDINHSTLGAEYKNKSFKIQAAVVKDNVGTTNGTLIGVRGWLYLDAVTLSAFHHNSSDDFDLYGVGGGNVGASTGGCAGEDRTTTGLYGRYKTGSHQFHARFATLDCDSASAENSVKVEYVNKFTKQARVWASIEQISSATGIAEPSLAGAGVRYDF